MMEMMEVMTAMVTTAAATSMATTPVATPATTAASAPVRWRRHHHCDEDRESETDQPLFHLDS